jgi:hypothetical protein
MWDRVKFARAPMTAEEAVRHELAVEALVRQHQARAATAAAAAAATAKGAGPTPARPDAGEAA